MMQVRRYVIYQLTYRGCFAIICSLMLLLKKENLLMPQRRTAIKDLRKAHTKHLHNLQIKTDLKKTVKKFTTAAS